MQTVDAVVVGAGPNGLVAANALADAGWDVLLLETNDRVGGAVRSDRSTHPDFVSDQFSSFYPLAAASPVIKDLQLTDHGLNWVQAPSVLAHPLTDGRAAVLHRAVADTAANLETFGAGDGDAWISLCEQWQRVRDPLLDALFSPLPPVRSTVALARRLGAAGLLDLARSAILPARRMGEEHFAGDGGKLLITGNALHGDVPPQAAGSGIFGWLLAMLGQDVGFPVPQGGAGELAEAMARRFTAAGGQVRTRTRVESILVAGGRALGVRTAGGELIRTRRAVLADVTAPALYRDLVGLQHFPSGMTALLDRFEWDFSTLKVNWALSGPIPWTMPGPAGAGTVHLGCDVDGFVDFAGDLTLGRMPRQAFTLLGQMTTADPSRSPAGTESVWAYTHIPAGADVGQLDRHVDLVQSQIESLATGFGELVLARTVQTPDDFEAADANLVGGRINGGTSGLHQQLVFRPTNGLGRPETPIRGLYLAGASAHPGGGVHGACGWNAARTALADAGRFGAARRALARTAWARLLPS